jgi:hypothetical protein
MDNQLLLPLLGVAAFLVAFAVFLVVAVRRARRRAPQVPAPEETLPTAIPTAAPPAGSELSRRLSKTRGGLFAKLGKYFDRSGAVGDAEWNEILVSPGTARKSAITASVKG